MVATPEWCAETGERRSPHPRRKPLRSSDIVAGIGAADADAKEELAPKLPGGHRADVALRRVRAVQHCSHSREAVGSSFTSRPGNSKPQSGHSSAPMATMVPHSRQIWWAAGRRPDDRPAASSARGRWDQCRSPTARTRMAPSHNSEACPERSTHRFGRSFLPPRRSARRAGFPSLLLSRVSLELAGQPCGARTARRPRPPLQGLRGTPQPGRTARLVSSGAAGALLTIHGS